MERGIREDVALVIKNDGRHKVGPKEGDWLYAGVEVITTYSCPTCYREVIREDWDGPWVHKARGIDPDEFSND